MRWLWVLWSPVWLVLWVMTGFYAVPGLVHALGHWIVGRWLGIETRFSLGTGFRWGPWGGERWRLSGLPGAYVTPLEDVPLTGRGLLFLSAGSVANGLSGVAGTFLGMLVIGMVGSTEPAPVVGLANLVSAEQVDDPHRFWVGDRVLAVDDVPVRSWMDVRAWVGPGTSVTVERAGETLRFPLEDVGRAGTWMRSSRVGVDDPDSPAGRAGMRTGMVVTAVDGLPVHTWDELQASLSIERLVVRFQTERDTYLTERAVGESWGLAPIETFVRHVVEGGAAKRAGLRREDHLVGVDGERLLGWAHLVHLIERAQGPMALEVRRAGETLLVHVEPKVVRGVGPWGEVTHKRLLGIRPWDRTRKPGPSTVVQRSLGDAIGYAAGRTGQALEVLAQVFASVMRGQPSDNVTVSNPSNIDDWAQQDGRWRWDRTAHWLLVMWLACSVWFMLYNLLPLPWSDALTMLERGISRVRGRRTSLQWVGWLALLVPMVVVVVNDMSRWMGE